MIAGSRHEHGTAAPAQHGVQAHHDGRKKGADETKLIYPRRSFISRRSFIYVAMYFLLILMARLLRPVSTKPMTIRTSGQPAESTKFS